MSRLNTAFTALGVDQFLIAESKKNNELLRDTPRSATSRAHTPNIYRIDSLEQSLKRGAFARTPRSKRNLCEKSIKSKSHFLYNARMSLQTSNRAETESDDGTDDDEDEEDVDDDDDDDDAESESLNRIANEMQRLKAKNENRMNYFRSSTPLDSARSMKLGLQKIEDLLSNAKMSVKPNSSSGSKPKKRNELSIDFDDSLYELM